MARERIDKLLTIRISKSMIKRFSKTLAYARYIDKFRACDLLMDMCGRADKRYRVRCRNRSIDPDRITAGVTGRIAKPMPDLRKPGPKVD